MNIVSLHKPDPNTVAILKDLLRQAEAGEIISLIYSAEVIGGTTQSGHTPIENVYSVVGRLERMKALLFQSLDNEETA